MSTARAMRMSFLHPVSNSYTIDNLATSARHRPRSECSKDDDRQEVDDHQQDQHLSPRELLCFSAPASLDLVLSTAEAAAATSGDFAT